MRFFTWSNDPTNPKLAPLKESADRLGIKLEYCGLNAVKWHHYDKIRYLQQALYSLGSEEIICVVDAHDVFFQKGEEELTYDFNSFQVDAVFGAERGYEQQLRKYKDYYDKLKVDSPYRYVNSGTLIGTVQSLRQIYVPSFAGKLKKVVSSRPFWKKQADRIRFYRDRFMEKLGPAKITPRNEKQQRFFYRPWYDYNDQTHVGKFIATDKTLNIALDHETKLFWCVAQDYDKIDKHFILKNDLLKNVHTGKTPGIVHVPFEKRHRSVFEHLFSLVYN